MPEVHIVTTKDGYILKIFRCNSKNSTNNGRVAILHHGLIASSDDYAMNIPSQSLSKSIIISTF